MFLLLSYILYIFFSIFKSKKQLIIQLAVAKKEIEILKRRNKHIKTKLKDRLLFLLLSSAADIKNIIVIVKPETLLKWQKEVIKKYWIYNKKKETRQTSCHKRY